MTRIKPLQEQQADKATAQVLKAVQAKLGMVPKLFSTFARSPAVLNGYLAFNESLSAGRLTARQREIIALAVAQANTCEYCLSAHTALGQGAGLSEAEILDARRGAGTEPKDHALAALASQLTRQRGQVSDADFNAAQNAGLDDGLIVEVIANVVLNVLTNYTNHVAGTEIDFPVVRAQLALAA